MNHHSPAQNGADNISIYFFLSFYFLECRSLFLDSANKNWERNEKVVETLHFFEWFSFIRFDVKICILMYAYVFLCILMYSYVFICIQNFKKLIIYRYLKSICCFLYSLYIVPNMPLRGRSQVVSMSLQHRFLVTFWLFSHNIFMSLGPLISLQTLHSSSSQGACSS